jgi:hypothetical protein
MCREFPCKKECVMGILQRIFGRTEKSGPAIEQDSTPDNCPHTALVPHWDNPADMGDKTRAMYRCEACGATFDYDSAVQFLEEPPAVLTSVVPDPERAEDDS